MHITPWSSADWARQAVADGIVAHLGPRAVRYVLSAVHLQPHRTRSWKTARLDARIKGASNFSGRGSGQAFFDAKAGRLDHSSHTLDISADLEIEIGGKVTKVSINQTQTATVRVSDHNPLND